MVEVGRSRGQSGSQGIFVHVVSWLFIGISSERGAVLKSYEHGSNHGLWVLRSVGSQFTMLCVCVFHTVAQSRTTGRTSYCVNLLTSWTRDQGKFRLWMDLCDPVLQQCVAYQHSQ